MLRKSLSSCFLLAAMLVWTVGCGDGGGQYKTAGELKKDRPAPAKDPHDHGHDHGHGHDEHAHKAPHNGSLSMVGDHAAQVEVVVDEAEGKLKLYVLDGEAEKSLSVKEEELALELKLDSKGEPVKLSVKAADGVFSGQSDALKKPPHEFGFKIEAITINDKLYEGLSLNYHEPHAEGDHAHAHDHDHAGEKKADAADKKPTDKHDHDHDHADEKPAVKKE